MTIGKKIAEARKKTGTTLAVLAEKINMSVSGTAKIENDGVKNIDPDLLCKIADALNDMSILVEHCQECQVRKHVFLKQFPDLNNIRRDPAVIAGRLRKEMLEAAEAMDRLSDRFSDADFKSREDYMDIFLAEMEQIIDAKRCIEILELELILSGTHSSAELQKVYDRQQAKCEANGHHNPAKEQAA